MRLFTREGLLALTDILSCHELLDLHIFIWVMMSYGTGKFVVNWWYSFCNNTLCNTDAVVT